MSEARRKNEIALARYSSQLQNLLESFRIGIWSDNCNVGASGFILAEALGEILGRFWQKLNVSGAISEIFMTAANQSAQSGGQQSPAIITWNPPYDIVIAIGTNPPSNSGFGIQVGAYGWQVTIGSNAFLSDDPNPVGPAAAAALVGAEIFKRCFADILGDRAKLLPDDYVWSAWDHGHGESGNVLPLDLNDLHIFGVGAVTHGLLWLLERWPAEVKGILHLIDPDKYDESNGQRYIGMRPGDSGIPKSLRAADRIRSRHKNLKVLNHDIDMNKYFLTKRQDYNVRLAVVGVDSPEHRRQLSLKLPLRIVNMWTEEDRLGASRFGFSDEWPCIFCYYPENTSDNQDETGQFSKMTKLKPKRVRELLFSSEGLNHDDISIISSHYNIPDPSAFLNKPLRSIIGNLCAMSTIKLPEAQKEDDVPFAFSSFFAGIGGFVELLHELYGLCLKPGHWQLSILNYPTPYSWFPRTRIKDCYLCGDDMVREILENKYKIP
ncbi:MAG: ThiF family adenylyltransferase [Deltaproteobacteria bacterium]|nr:ThiF family adenylyltransferase [Deltaproteobacteria bacterium]